MKEDGQYDIVGDMAELDKEIKAYWKKTMRLLRRRLILVASSMYDLLQQNGKC